METHFEVNFSPIHPSINASNQLSIYQLSINHGSSCPRRQGSVIFHEEMKPVSASLTMCLCCLAFPCELLRHPRPSEFRQTSGTLTPTLKLCHTGELVNKLICAFLGNTSQHGLQGKCVGGLSVASRGTNGELTQPLSVVWGLRQKTNKNQKKKTKPKNQAESVTFIAAPPEVQLCCRGAL